MNRSFLRGAFVLAGTTIGAGIFGIPYVTAKVGYPLGLFWLLVLAAFTLILNLSYAFIVTKTRGKNTQLVGYASKYLGVWGERLALFVILVGQWSALLAYIIGVGTFVTVILGFDVGQKLFSTLFFIIMAVITVSGLRLASVLETWLTYAMITIIIVIAITAFPMISISNLGFNGTSLAKSTSIAGVILGALTGFVVVPEVQRSLGKGSTKKEFVLAVVIGTLIPTVVYLVFQFVVVGVSGDATSESAIAGLVPYLNDEIIKLGAFFGILAMTSSFIALAHVIKGMFMYDFRVPKIRAWYLAIVPPFALYLSGVNSFIVVLDIGGFLSGLTGAMIVFAILISLFRRSHKSK